MSETNNSQEPTNKSMLVLNFKFAIPALTFLVITSTLFAVMYWGIPAVIKECQNWIYILMFYTIIAIIVVSLCFVTIKLMNHYAQSFNSVQEVEIKLYEEQEKYKLKNENRKREIICFLTILGIIKSRLGLSKPKAAFILINK